MILNLRTLSPLIFDAVELGAAVMLARQVATYLHCC